MTDPDQDGDVHTHEWVSVEYHATGVHKDGTADNVSLVIEKHIVTNPTP
jgi:hypothetical protein